MDKFWIISYVALWVLVSVLGISLLAVIRQVGLLHLRLPPAGARTMSIGPAIGHRYGKLYSEDLLGRTVESH